MKKKKKKEEKSAIDLLEETIHLLRTAPISLLLPYFTGAVPFVLGLLYFWVDMSHDAFASSHIGGSVILISLLFIWMKSWQAGFASSLLSYLKGEPPTRWSIARVLRTIAEQTTLQPTALFLLPIFSMIILPFGFGYAFYQNASVYGAGSCPTLRALVSKSRFQAFLFPEQNHILLLILTVFGPLIFLNITILLYSFPMMLQTFFGLETAFKGWNLLNTTFWMVSGSISYLFLDPVVKTLYTLRCFYGESIRTGEDLMVELKGLQKREPIATGIALLLFIFLSFSGSVRPSFAAEQPLSPLAIESGGGRFSPADLDRSAEEVIKKREFSWRIPRQKVEISKTKGPLGEFLETAFYWAKRSLKQLFHWIGEVIEWILSHIFGRSGAGLPPSEGHSNGWNMHPMILLYLAVSVTASILGIGLFRIWKTKSKTGKKALEKAAGLEVNLSREEIKPDDLPASRWLELARQLMEKGERRLALRAFFLASLAYLAEKGTLTVAEFKSNREYENELKRRLRDHPEILSAFSDNREMFERVWYGRDEATLEIINDFNGNQERIMAYADSA